MKKQIFKFELEQETGVQEISMPEQATVLTCLLQGNKIVLWALVDPEAAKETRVFELVWTGKDFAHTRNHFHLNTVVVSSLVWHIFEILN